MAYAYLLMHLGISHPGPGCPVRLSGVVVGFFSLVSVSFPFMKHVPRYLSFSLACERNHSRGVGKVADPLMVG